MPLTSPILHLLCGKVASGKSTLTAKLGRLPETITIAEDEWLAGLFGNEMTSISDYARCSAKLRAILRPHIESLLKAGLSVVLDFPANTIESRTWMHGMIETTNAAHKLHYLDVPDEVCIARLKKRNADSDHPFKVTDRQYEQLSRYFVAPSADEGFDIVVHPFEDGKNGKY